MAYHFSRRFLTLCCGCALVLGAAGCEELGSEGGDARLDGGADAAPADSGVVPTGVVAFKAAGETEAVDFSSGSERYLVVPYSVSAQQAEAIEFMVKVEGGSVEQGLAEYRLIAPDRRLRLRETHPALWARWQRRLAVERWTRAQAERVAKMTLSRPRALGEGGYGQLLAGESCTLSSECVEAEVCHAGTCAAAVEVKVGAFASSVSTLQTTVQRKGESVAILVEDGSTVDGADLDALRDTFDNKIYPRSVALFGNPPLESGQPTLSSDRNGDGLVWIVVTDKVEEREAVGFFVATDFAGVAEDANSNEADILYMVAPGGAASNEAILTTAAHELQHLLSFGSKVYRPEVNEESGVLEALWLDEGQSHFAEDACGFGGENVTLLQDELFSSFSDTAMVTGDVDPEAGEDGLPMRAMAMTFVRFLFEQKGGVSYDGQGGIVDGGGAAWLQALHTVSVAGTAAVDATSPELDFRAAFDRWIATIALDNRGVTDSPLLNYRAPVTDPQAPGNAIGLRIRGTLKDASGDDVTLEGPLEEELAMGETTSAIPNTSGRFLLLEGQQGTLDVTVTSTASDIRYAVIKLQRESRVRSTRRTSDMARLAMMAVACLALFVAGGVRAAEVSSRPAPPPREKPPGKPTKILGSGVVKSGRLLVVRGVRGGEPQLTDEQGKSYLLTGKWRRELLRLHGHTIQVWGELGKKKLMQPTLRVDRYEMLGTDGHKPLVGRLQLGPDEQLSLHQEERVVPIRTSAALGKYLRRRIGCRIWIVGEMEASALRASRFGVLSCKGRVSIKPKKEENPNER